MTRSLLCIPYSYRISRYSLCIVLDTKYDSIFVTQTRKYDVGDPDELLLKAEKKLLSYRFQFLESDEDENLRVRGSSYKLRTCNIVLVI
jgi:hypothetical protein